MSMYKYVRQVWKKPSDALIAVQRSRMIQWRKDPSTIRLERPTRIDRARSLGYKAKPGIIVVRQKLLRGGRHRPRIKKGRRSKHAGHVKILGKNYQHVAEERADRKYPNCQVLNSYFVGKDGTHVWYEVILVDTAHPVTRKSNLKWITSSKHKGRAARGLTSAGRKGRGLRHKGKGAEKIRPSINAQKGRGN